MHRFTVICSTQIFADKFPLNYKRIGPVQIYQKINELDADGFLRFTELSGSYGALTFNSGECMM
jgi:hypothetical protein